jgi:general secretion pathway protein N
MRNTKRLVFAGILTLIIGLIITFPARVAYQWFAPGELRLNGISGSIWRGKAVQGSANGIYLSDLNWQIRPLSVLTGRLEYATNSKLASGFLDAKVAVGVGGSLTLSDVAAALTLDTLNGFLPLNGIEGDVSLQFDELVVQNGLPVEASGSLKVANLVSRYLSPTTGSLKVANLVSRYLSPTTLGDYEAEFQTDVDGILGSVETIRGILDLIGTIRLHDNRSYEFAGKVAARPDAPPGVARQLQYLGSPDAQGKREFRIEGQL